MPKYKRKGPELTKDQLAKAAANAEELKRNNPDAFELPKSNRTVEDLATYFHSVDELSTLILPKEKRKYVIYLRKSTDDEQKQVRSLDDQETECKELARWLGLKERQIIIRKESASAKISGNRPIFDEVIKGFMTGKYHGLIAWSPDRLSRNMKEGGEIIEMIDQEYIQDLHFKTYQFDNTPNGKMLLGILFATSKQYSDKLAVDVTRGNAGKVREGRYMGSIKKGYYAEKDTWHFIPDGYNWELLRQAVDMRLRQGKTNVEIARFLNDSHLSMRKDQDDPPRIIKMTKTNVGALFEDSFYFGLFKYGKNIVNLTEVSDFLPLITPDEYIKLNQKIAYNFDEKSVARNANTKRLDYGLLRNKVVCDYCDEPMQFQHQILKRGKNAGKWLISFYCRNKECLRHNEEEQAKQGIKLQKSIRAKYVMAHIEWTLRHCTKKSRRAYEMHIESLKQKLAVDREIAKRKLGQAKKDFEYNKKMYIKYQNFQVEDPAAYKKHHNGKLEYHENLMKIAEHKTTEAEQRLAELKAGLPTEQEFYELIGSYLEKLLSAKDILETDIICNELVSNLRAGDDSVSVIKLNPPYDLMVDLAKVSNGRG